MPQKARRENSYEESSPAILARLKAIRALKTIGYTLHEIQAAIETYEIGSLDCMLGKEQILTKGQLIDEQISQLQTIKQQLLEAVSDCLNHCKITAILDQTLAVEK